MLLIHLWPPLKFFVCFNCYASRVPVNISQKFSLPKSRTEVTELHNMNYMYVWTFGRKSNLKYSSLQTRRRRGVTQEWPESRTRFGLVTFRCGSRVTQRQIPSILILERVGRARDTARWVLHHLPSVWVEEISGFRGRVHEICQRMGCIRAFCSWSTWNSIVLVLT